MIFQLTPSVKRLIFNRYEQVHAFFISITFIMLIRLYFYKHARLKIAKNQANAKHHPEAENYSHSLCENNKIYSRKEAKDENEKWITKIRHI